MVRNLRRFGLAAAFVLLGQANITSVSAATLTGFSSFTDEFVSINTDTGAVSSLGSVDGLNFVTGLATASDGTLFAAQGDSIFTVDLTAGTSTLVQDFFGVNMFNGLDFAPDGTAFVVETVFETFATLDFSNGTVDTIAGPDGAVGLVGLTISPDGSTAFSHNVFTDELIAFDIATGEVSIVGSTPNNLNSLAFADGVLFGTVETSTDSLVTLDRATGAIFSSIELSTGASTNISALTGPAIVSDPPVAAVPLPAALPLFLSGMAAMVFVARRRSRAV